MHDSTNNQVAADPRRIVIATMLALLVAIVILFTAILPAEFGRDPLGTGALLGLDALSAEENPFEPQPGQHASDYVEFELEPFQSVEYKYLMDLDAPMVFSWRADGELYFDMHAEPAGLGEEYAESFEQGSDSARSGSYHAPFTGIHGWFWENRSLDTVTVRLNAAGFLINSTVFRDGGTFERELQPLGD